MDTRQLLTRRSPGEAFTRLCQAVVERLPPRFRSVVEPTMVGFALINATTFLIDLAIVTLVHGAFGLPLVLAVTGGYAVALLVGFGLNRALNFRSHGRLGRETTRYGLVVATNFVVLLLGITTLLSSAGVPYQASRLVAGLAEAVFMYLALKWFVFRSPGGMGDPRGGAGLGCT